MHFSIRATEDGAVGVLASLFSGDHVRLRSTPPAAMSPSTKKALRSFRFCEWQPGDGVEMSGQGAAVIAVVDDDHAVLESVFDLLASAGYAACTFSSAGEFLDSGALHSIGCLVSDIHMPGMDGWELQSVAHEQRPDLPIILMTGNDEEERKARTRPLAGRTRLLFNKPFDGQQLIAATKEALEGKTGWSR